jgi:hypothetical protein
MSDDKTVKVERRDKPRESFETKVIIVTRDEEFYQTVSKDISLRGVYVREKRLKEGMECTTIIALTDSYPELRVELHGKVVRVDENGAGIVFRQPMDLDSFIYLQNIVAYNNRSCEMLPQ